MIDHNLAFDPEFSARDFVELHVFSGDIPLMFSDFFVREAYAARFAQALGIWEEACHNLPESWGFVDEERTISVEFPFTEVKKLLDRGLDRHFLVAAIMKTACHYAIVRFMPFVETGEFANVGVVMFAPNGRFFGFKLLINRHARVTNFFEELDARIFRASMRSLRDELERIDGMLKRMGTDRRFKSLDRAGALGLWSEIVKPRETMLRFSDSRLVLADDAQGKLQELYAYYVERNFVTRDYQEKILERGVRGWLRSANLLERFHPARIGNDEYHAQFPFVAGPEEKPEKIIKPLNLGYADAARIIDHGGQWVVRINALKKRDLLPDRVLFAVDGPDDSTPRGKAKREVVGELEDAGVIVTPYGQAQAVIDFARQ